MMYIIRAIHRFGNMLIPLRHGVMLHPQEVFNALKSPLQQAIRVMFIYYVKGVLQLLQDFFLHQMQQEVLLLELYQKYMTRMQQQVQRYHAIRHGMICQLQLTLTQQQLFM